MKFRDLMRVGAIGGAIVAGLAVVVAALSPAAPSSTTVSTAGLQALIQRRDDGWWYVIPVQGVVGSEVANGPYVDRKTAIAAATAEMWKIAGVFDGGDDAPPLPPADEPEQPPAPEPPANPFPGFGEGASPTLQTPKLMPSTSGTSPTLVGGN